MTTGTGGAGGVRRPPERPGDDARRWVVELPAGLATITDNDRLHHMERHRRVKDIREAAGTIAAAMRIPRLERVWIDAEYRPGWRDRRRDAANWQPSFKPAVDGLVDAGVLADDDHTRVAGPFPMIGPVDGQSRRFRLRYGRIVLTVYEMPPGGGEGAR